MNGFTLKLIAVVTMLIDHVAAVLITDPSAYWIGRGVGRLAFPIYCFLIVEGFYHTKNVKKYLIRLGIFALISEIPFDLAFSTNLNLNSFLDQQNVFFTLFIGLAVIYAMSTIDKRFATKMLNTKMLAIKMLAMNLLDSLAVVVGCLIATLLSTDYKYLGVILIVSFYLFRTKKVLLTITVLIITYYLGGTLEGLATISMIFIWFYNGERGPKVNRYIFYAFYPVHILVIFFISLLPMFH